MTGGGPYQGGEYLWLDRPLLSESSTAARKRLPVWGTELMAGIP